MFTGLVQAVGRAASVVPVQSGVRLRLDFGGWSPEGGRPIAMGDSISVSGVCLTVAALDEEERDRRSRLLVGFDVVSQTLGRTTLGGLQVGHRVNLEPAVTPTQPMGGHFVQGHVDGVGEVIEVRSDAADWRVTVRPPGEMMRYMTPQGSLCIDGVSLTLADVDADTLTVALVPTTLRETTLGDLAAGSRVNLEADIISKQVVAYLDRLRPPRDEGEAEAVTMGLLERAGFTR